MMMRISILLAVTALISFLLIRADLILEAFSFSVLDSEYLNRQVFYQPYTLFLAILVTGIGYLLQKKSLAYLTWGNTNTPADNIKWLGISDKKSWGRNALEMGIVISIATFSFMLMVIWNQNPNYANLLFYLPFILLFSATNALSEELIFRFFPIALLQGYWQAPQIALCAGLLFGIPHYFGHPGGFLGMLMAAFLGWLLALSIQKTRGLGIAFLLHFVQDVIIIGLLSTV